jgi:hypothetical protein
MPRENGGLVVPGTPYFGILGLQMGPGGMMPENAKYWRSWIAKLSCFLHGILSKTGMPPQKRYICRTPVHLNLLFRSVIPVRSVIPQMNTVSHRYVELLVPRGNA